MNYLSAVFSVFLFSQVVWSQCSGELNRISANASDRSSSAYPFQAGIDGNASTSWRVSSASQQWFTIDLGSVQTVSGVQLEWVSGMYARDFDIRYSIDGSSFFTAYSEDNGQGSATPQSFTSIQARYIGMDLNQGVSSFSGFGISEYRVFSTCSEGNNNSALSIPQMIPLPQSVSLTGESDWSSLDGISLNSDALTQSWSDILNTITTETGMSESGTPFDLELNSARTDLGDEGYELRVSGDSIQVLAASEMGLFYGIQSLRQMWLSELEHQAMLITDIPTNSWRGLMLDPARNFIPLEYLKQTVDRMAILKLNRLHLHLTDDQGWRIEINSWPNLHLIGSNSSTSNNPGYYTQAQYSELVSYAQERGVIVVPEIDLPGHTHAIKAAYPQFGCGTDVGWPYTGFEVGFSKLCLTRPDIYDFVEDVLDEVIALTPGPWIHIGGDEIEDDLYDTFITNMDQYVSSQGKIMVGWQEIRGGTLSSNTIFQQWKLTGSTAGAQPWINSTCSGAYLDHPEQFGGSGLTWCVPVVTDQNAYNHTPGSEGSEVALWGELMADTSVVSDRLYPRLYSAAEASWTPSNRKSWSGFTARRLNLTTALQGRVPEGTVSLITQGSQQRPVMFSGSQFYTVEGRSLSEEPQSGRYIKRDEFGAYQVIVKP